MSLGKSILSFFTAALKIGATLAPDVVSAYSPPLGRLLDTVLTHVVHAEATVPGQGQGSIKAGVVNLLLNESGADIAALFSTAGKPIKNPELFAAGVTDLQAAVVKILNATGDLAKGQPAS